MSFYWSFLVHESIPLPFVCCLPALVSEMGSSASMFTNLLVPLGSFYSLITNGILAHLCASPSTKNGISFFSSPYSYSFFICYFEHHKYDLSTLLCWSFESTLHYLHSLHDSYFLTQPNCLFMCFSCLKALHWLLTWILSLAYFGQLLAKTFQCSVLDWNGSTTLEEW